jgi:hypothetical protein
MSHNLAAIVPEQSGFIKKAADSFMGNEPNYN